MINKNHVIILEPLKQTDIRMSRQMKKYAINKYTLIIFVIRVPTQVLKVIKRS